MHTGLYLPPSSRFHWEPSFRSVCWLRLVPVSGGAPFGLVRYVSAPNAQGDRLVVGDMAEHEYDQSQGKIPSVAQFSKSEILWFGADGSRIVRGGICPDAAGTQR